MKQGLILSLIVFTKVALGDCLPEFPLTNEWRGGDAIYSVSLNDSETLWLFGDSFISDNGVRRDSQFVNNSIAVSSCHNGIWSIEYFWKNSLDGLARSFFNRPGQEGFYWPKDAFYYDGKIYVFLVDVKYNNNPEIFGFRLMGTDLATITPTGEDPREWTVDYQTAVDKDWLFPGSGVFLAGEFVYSYSVIQDQDSPSENKPVVVQRLSLTKLDNAAENFEYLSKDESWKAGFDQNDAMIVLTQGRHELSVQYLPMENRWRLLMSSPEIFSSTTKVFYNDSPFSPWGDGDVVFTYPEMSPAGSGIFCYAAKEHYRYSIFTYVCNAWPPEVILDNEEIYRPVVVEWYNAPPL